MIEPGMIEPGMIELPALVHSGRLDRVRAEARDRVGVVALYVSDPLNIRWCSGFSGSTSWLVILPDRALLGTDRRYEERALAEIAAAGLAGEVEVAVRSTQAELWELLIDALGGFAEVGAESTHLSHARWAALADEVALRAVDPVFREVRRSKHAAEVERIAAASAIADRALAEVVGMLANRPTETDVRDELEYRMRRLGADGPSYDTIVASGPLNAARPHHGAERRTIEEHDTVVIDVGALVDGYHSDMTRSYVVGEPSPEQLEIYQLVLASQRAGLEALAPGVASRDIDRACRSVFEDAGYADWYLHGTGHGVGLAIHEDPFHAAWSESSLVVGDVVTVEPGLYRAGFGGFRVEDLVVITDTGHRILTHTPKDVPCLPSPPTT
jgi:Xaa-Pro aminopeptidase